MKLPGQLRRAMTISLVEFVNHETKQQWLECCVTISESHGGESVTIVNRGMPALLTAADILKQATEAAAGPDIPPQPQIVVPH